METAEMGRDKSYIPADGCLCIKSTVIYAKNKYYCMTNDKLILNRLVLSNFVSLFLHSLHSRS